MQDKPMKKTLLIILVSCSALLTLPAFAETVRVPVGQQADIAKPRTGLSRRNSVSPSANKGR
jgi:hypothetical protein